jgi:hypothetical protein
MTNLIELAGGMSIAVKVAWVVLVLWAAGQIVWYRRGRETVLPPMAPTPRRPASRRPQKVEEPQPEGAPV